MAFQAKAHLQNEVAGHGIRVNGRNWLIPTNAKLVRVEDLRYEALLAEEHPLELMAESRARVKAT